MAHDILRLLSSTRPCMCCTQPSLQKHFSQCGGCHTFTCIDCSATFDRRSVLGHSTCVTGEGLGGGLREILRPSGLSGMDIYMAPLQGSNSRFIYNPLGTTFMMQSTRSTPLAPLSPAVSPPRASKRSRRPMAARLGMSPRASSSCPLGPRGSAGGNTARASSFDCLTGTSGRRPSPIHVKSDGPIRRNLCP